eukprot:1157368-Pelagomonas_calceolata.AAC.5
MAYVSDPPARKLLLLALAEPVHDNKKEMQAAQQTMRRTSLEAPHQLLQQYRYACFASRLDNQYILHEIGESYLVVLFTGSQPMCATLNCYDYLPGSGAKMTSVKVYEMAYQDNFYLC